ncbi:MAG: hypothetical protein ABRQ26_15815 [Syntrophomonadaceae bacterium]
MESSGKFLNHAGTFQEVQLAEAEAEAKPARMVNHINILGFSQPEKLAEGLCPQCNAMLDLWISGQGLELSRLGNYDIDELATRTEYREKNPPDIRARNFPIIMDASETANTKSSLMGALMDFLLKPIPCSINLKKTVVYLILTVALIALVIRAVYYFWPAIWEPRIILLDTDWITIAGILILILIGLVAVNYLAYKFKSSDSGPNQIDRWMLASSLIIVIYCLLSWIALPLLLVYKLNLLLY